MTGCVGLKWPGFFVKQQAGYPVHRFLFLTLSVAVLSGCMLGPDYQRPQQQLPQQFTQVEGWKLAEPGMLAETGYWWRLYEDALLHELLERLDEQNQSLAAAEAAWRAAQAALGGSRSALYPQLSGSGGSTRSSAAGDAEITKSKNVQLGLGWQLDLWGEVRRQIEAGQARADASAADWAALRLSLQTQLVQSYVELRTLDEQIRILQRNLDSYARVLRITENRYQGGLVTRSDVSQALSQLKSTEAQYLNLQSQRSRLQHSIAVLLGQPASGFQLEARSGLPAMPLLPAEIPSALLERRPDIAAAEQRVIAANAEIGVAKTAYFPSFSFSASGGYRAGQWSGLLDTPNRFWSIGPQFDLRIFDAGARRAQSQQAQAGYEQQVANYRQITLQAIAEVEDALVQLLSLKAEYEVQEQAHVAAQEALRLIENQYQAGMVDYLSVSTAQTAALNAERTLLELKASQLTASVQLVGALGGGWQRDDSAQQAVQGG